MVDSDIKLLDKIYLQKYIYLLKLFTSGQIPTSIFESIFLQIRREDTYWLSGQLNKKISRLLDNFFLDVDEYHPDNLFNSDSKFNINENELRKRANETLNKLKDIPSSPEFVT